MKRILVAICIMILISCEVFATSTNVPNELNNSNLSTYRTLIKSHRKVISDLLGSKYSEFLNSIGKEDIIDINYCCTRFRPGNNTLVIGSSGAVHLGCTMEDELDKYHSDVLGLGGTTDNFMLEWIPYINKHYDKIIIINCINSINVCCEYDYSLVGKEFVDDIKIVCDSCKSLLTETGKIAYLTPVPYKENTTGYTKNYNAFIDKLVPDLENAGIPLLEVDYQLSGGGLHSHDKKLFTQIITCLNDTIFNVEQPIREQPKSEQLDSGFGLAKEQYAQYKDVYLNAIEKNISTKDAKKPWQTNFDSNNRKLIIGCSPVAYMNAHAAESLKEYGYDLISFGGVFDKEIINWLRILDKKYDRIVIWCAINDIFDSLNNGKVLQDDYFRTIDSVFDEAKNHLNNNTSIIFVNVKPLTEIDIPLPDYCHLFNIEAKKVNEYVAGKGIKCVDVVTSTDKENSEWYIHYTNPAVYNYLMSYIEILDPR